MKKEHSTPPVARIIQRDGETLGEVTGTPGAIAQVDSRIQERAEILGCRFDTTQVNTDGASTLTVKATPRKCHFIGTDPERKLLKAIFTDDRRGSPGAMLAFKSY